MTIVEENEVLKASITEQRHMYDVIGNVYDQLRIKALALIAGEVAILTFLFTDWKVGAVLAGPDRITLFFTGIVFLALAFGVLLWVISTVKWKLAHSFDTSQKIFSDQNKNTPRRFLEYLHDDYTKVNEHCSRIVSNKCDKFNWAVYLLAAGVIILMVIKFGGPQQ